MPIPAPIPVDSPQFADIPVESEQPYSFLPEMETALDTASPSAQAGRVVAPDPDLVALFGPPLRSALAAVLAKRGGAGLPVTASSANPEAAGELATATDDEIPAAGLLLSPSLISDVAGSSDREAAPSSFDNLPDDEANLLAAAAPVLPPPESASPPPPAAFGLNFENRTSPDAAAVDEIRTDEPRQQILSAAQASAQPAAALASQPGNGLRQSNLNMSPSPRTKSAAVSHTLPKFHDDVAAAAAEAPRLEPAEAAAGGSPAFQALIKQQDSGRAAVAAAPPAHPARQEHHPNRSALNTKPATRAIGPHGSGAVQDSVPDRHHSIPASQNENELQPARQSPSLAVTASSSTAPLNTQNSAGTGLSFSGASFDSPAADLSGPAMSIDEPPQPAGSGSQAHVSMDHDLDPAASRDSLRAVSLKLEGAGGAAVHLKFTERRGEVHVVTRTHDAVLGERLASDLPELRRAIEDSGMSADVWASNQEFTVRRESEPSRSDSGSNPSQQSGAWFRHGDSAGRRQGGHHDRWADQIEDALDGAQGGRK